VKTLLACTVAIASLLMPVNAIAQNVSNPVDRAFLRSFSSDLQVNRVYRDLAAGGHYYIIIAESICALLNEGETTVQDQFNTNERASTEETRVVLDAVLDNAIEYYCPNHREELIRLRGRR